MLALVGGAAAAAAPAATCALASGLGAVAHEVTHAAAIETLAVVASAANARNGLVPLRSLTLHVSVRPHARAIVSPPPAAIPFAAYRASRPGYWESHVRTHCDWRQACSDSAPCAPPS